jgi:hypothetical protein
MFDINSQAAAYIRTHGNMVTVDLKFQPAIGDIPCASRKLAGCYAPNIRIGEKIGALNSQFRTEFIDDITIYYHPNLREKIGYPSIHLVLKQFLFWEWLELEGAKIMPIFND